MRSAKEMIRALELMPHPEGGFYRETFRDQAGGERGHSSAIYYLLEGGEPAAWHRLRDAVEIWHYYAGAPLALSLVQDGAVVQPFRLGADIAGGDEPQIVVPRSCWQRAESLGAWTLCGCTVAPGFVFSQFEMAPPDWRPPVAPPL